ncbi:MAG: DNA endonuclease SmrA, partial [Aeromonas veronii]
MSHNDELSLFMNEVADVRPIRSDNIHPHAAKSAPTEAQLARRQAATA